MEKVKAGENLKKAWDIYYNSFLETVRSTTFRDTYILDFWNIARSSAESRKECRSWTTFNTLKREIL